MRPAQNCGSNRCRRAPRRVFPSARGLFAPARERPPDKTLLRRAHHQRIAELRQFRQMRQQLIILLVRFPEAEARIDQNL